MKASTSVKTGVEQQISRKIRERRSKARVCPNHQLYLKLQQMSLLCRLFDKKVQIDTRQGSIVTPVYLATPKTVILNDGRFIPISDIVEVNVC